MEFIFLTFTRRLCVIFGLSVLISLTSQIQPVFATLRHFAKIDENVYRGSNPLYTDDYDELKKLSIRTILDLQAFPIDIYISKKISEKNGFNFISRPMSALTQHPSKNDVAELLKIMSDTNLQPIYVHCLFGKDRTGLVIAMYRIHVQHWPATEAYQEMKQEGFNPYLVPGLYYFFIRHQDPGKILGASKIMMIEPKNA